MNKTLQRRIDVLQTQHSLPLSDRLVTLLADHFDVQEVEVGREMARLQEQFRKAVAIWNRHIEDVAQQRDMRPADLRARLIAMGVPLR